MSNANDIEALIADGESLAKEHEDDASANIGLWAHGPLVRRAEVLSRLIAALRAERLRADDAEEEGARLRETLELIAAPKRPDGTYNRCREACESLARQTLDGAPESNGPGGGKQV